MSPSCAFRVFAASLRLGLRVKDEFRRNKPSCSLFEQKKAHFMHLIANAFLLRGEGREKSNRSGGTSTWRGLQAAIVEMKFTSASWRSLPVRRARAVGVQQLPHRPAALPLARSLEGLAEAHSSILRAAFRTSQLNSAATPLIGADQFIEMPHLAFHPPIYLFAIDVAFTGSSDSLLIGSMPLLS